MRRLEALAALLLTGCSLLGLTEVPPQGECSRCEELNLIELPPDCMSWQCGPENLCVVDLVDQDGDGAPFPRCATADRPADCDDLDGANGPDQVEVCDARDNDCDEVIDEGVELGFVRMEPSSDTREWSWARAPRESGGTLYGAALEQNGRIFLSQGNALEDFVPLPVPAPNSGTSVSVFGEERAVAYVGGECGALRIWRYTSELRVEASDALPRFGACDRDNPMVSPVLVLDRERRGLALSHSEVRDTCEASGGGRLFASLVIRESDEWGPEPAALMLDTHDGLGPAALLALDELDFVVAHVEGETLRVTQVEVDATDLSLSRRELHAEPCGEGCGHVSLASAVVDGTREVAVAFRGGTCAAPELRLRRLAVEGQTASPIGDTAVLAAGTPSRIAVAGRPEAPSWAVAWSNEEGVRIERVPSETPIAPLVLPTPARVEEAMDIAYSESLVLAFYEANMGQIATATLTCAPRVDAMEE